MEKIPTKKKSSGRALAYAGIITAVGMLFGRLAGFVRELFVASYFGTSTLADSSIVLLTLPDLLIGLFMGGAINIVFIPFFQKIPNQERFRTFVTIQLFTVMSFISLCLVFYVGAHFLLDILAPSLDSKAKLELLPLLRWTLIAVPITAGTAVTRAFLQSEQRFTTTAFANFIYNLIVILCISLFTGRWGIEAVVFGIILGTTLRWCSQLANILFVVPRVWPFKSKIPARELTAKYAQALGAGTILILYPYIARSFASLYFEDGSIAIFNYAYKLTELPFGVAISVFAIVIFPKLSSLSKDTVGLSQSAHLLVSRSIEVLFFLSIPLSLSLIWLFYHYQLNPIEVFNIPSLHIKAICELTILGLLALPIRGLSSMHIAILSSKKDTLGPLYINLFCLSVLAVGCLFIKKVPTLSAIGLPLLVTYCCCCLLEILYLWKKHEVRMKDYFSIKTVLLPGLVSVAVFSFLSTFCWKFNLDQPVELFIMAVCGGTLCLVVQLFLNKEIVRSIKNK